MTIRIVSYNIHGGKGTDGVQDYARINAMLEEVQADIVLLQEFDTRTSKRKTDRDIAALSGTRFSNFVAGITIRGKHGWYGNAVMSRFPVLGHETIDITMPGAEPRNIMEVVLDTHEGILRVLNTHKGLRHGERQQQLEKLYTLIDREADLPLFVGGDINEWHTSSKAMRKLNKALHPVPLPRTFPTRLPIFHLDRIWCRPAGILQNADILRTPKTKVVSDHYPVVAELKGLKDRPLTEIAPESNEEA